MGSRPVRNVGRSTCQRAEHGRPWAGHVICSQRGGQGSDPMTFHREPQEKALSPPRFPRRCDTGQFVPVRRACRQLVENTLQVHKGQGWGSEIIRGRASYGGCAWAQETVSPGRVWEGETRWWWMRNGERERRASGMTRKRQHRSGCQGPSRRDGADPGREQGAALTGRACGSCRAGYRLLLLFRFALFCFDDMQELKTQR